MKPYVKPIAITVGGLFAIAHIGLLGYVVYRPKLPQIPTINIPNGEYSSYRIKANRDGYEIEYKANDPAILESQRSLNLQKDKRGLFGPTTEDRREWRREQYTMDGARNLGGSGGAIGESGKMNAQSAECIAADAGARSQGAMAGTAISTGLIVPIVGNIPYIGWLASGWALLLGQQVGSEIGSEISSSFNDC